MSDLFNQLLDYAMGTRIEDSPTPPPLDDTYGFSMAEKAKHHMPTLPITDFRNVPATKSFTGKYDPAIVQELISGAKQFHLDPKLVLSMGMQESGLGKHSPSNPLQLNQKSFKWPSEELLGHLDDSLTSQEARDAMDREAAIPVSLSYLKQMMMKFHSPETGIQAYNGLAKPKALNTKYGVAPEGTLPTNFYTKRVMDVKNGVINQSPLIKEMLKRAGMDD